MKRPVEGLDIFEWLLKKTFCELDIMGADLVNAHYESSLELLQHQYDL
jgi:hypothetical protein